MTKVTFTRHGRPNFRQAEKVDRLLGSYETVRYFPSVYRELRAICVWPWKMVSVSVRYLFYKPIDEKMQTWPLRFPAKEKSNMEKALFHWPIVLQFDVKAKCRLISRKLFGHEVFSTERSLNQPKPTRVCIRWTNQSNRSISVRLFFLFCTNVFISRSYENRSNS